MSHFSPIPPNERIYADNYRKELEPYEAQLVEVSGRCKEFRDHTERKDLQSMLLVNVQIRPVGKRRLIKLTHLWVLSKHVKRVGVHPKCGRRLKFIGSVYAYFRLGGNSRQRGLFQSHDFSILPMQAVDIQTFKPGINARYENKVSSSDRGTAVKENRGSGEVGEGTPNRSKHPNSRRRNDGNAKRRSRHRDRKPLTDQHEGPSCPVKSRKSPKTDSSGGTKDSRD